MEVFSVGFEVEKETKNTVKYAEKPAVGVPPRIGALYVQKWVVGEKPPKRLTVTVEETK